METVDGQILLFIQEHIRNAVGDVFLEESHIWAMQASSGLC